MFKSEKVRDERRICITESPWMKIYKRIYTYFEDNKSRVIGMKRFHNFIYAKLIDLKGITGRNNNNNQNLNQNSINILCFNNRKVLRIKPFRLLRVHNNKT